MDRPEINRRFQVFRKGDDLYESEFERAPDGSDVFRETEKLVYAVGARENADTYLVQRGSRLFEAPLSFYAKSKRWDLSPGYQGGDDVGFTRAVPSGCLFCHAGEARFDQAAPEGVYKQPPFAELAIGCERCHGPGAEHVRGKSSAIRASSSESNIVNPARLPGWLSDNVCMGCHETGSARIVHPGLSEFDFRPGEPLDKTVSLFAYAASAANASSTAAVLSHYQGMIASKCYRASGKMRCTTCHDPHTEPETTVAYRPKCLGCHTILSCRAPWVSRNATAPADNCVTCHMIRKPVTNIAHSVLTDHRIVARADERLPDLATTAFSRDTGLLHLTADPNEENDAVEPAILFRAYTEAVSVHRDLSSRWIALMQKLVNEGAGDPYVYAQAGSFLARQEGSSEARAHAIEFLSRAVAGKVNLPGVYLLLAGLQEKEGALTNAIQTIQTGLETNPLSPDLHRNLIYLYGRTAEYKKALGETDAYLKDFPQDDGIRKLLPQIQALAR